MSILDVNKINRTLDEYAIKEAFKRDYCTMSDYHRYTQPITATVYETDVYAYIEAICYYHESLSLPNAHNLTVNCWWDAPNYGCRHTGSDYLGLRMDARECGVVFFTDETGALLKNEALCKRVFIPDDVDVVIYTTHPHPRLLTRRTWSSTSPRTYKSLSTLLFDMEDAYDTLTSKRGLGNQLVTWFRAKSRSHI